MYQAATTRFTPTAHSLRATESEKESRFVIGSAAIHSIIQTLDHRLCRQVYDSRLSVAYNWTVYLDTINHDLARSQPGQPSRRIRIRNYAAASNDREAPQPVGKSFLELKQRSNGHREKTRMAVSASWLRRSLSIGTIGETGAVAPRGLAKSKLLRDLANRGRAPWLDQLLDTAALVPCLVTCYRRTSFIGHGGRVRVTLDDRLCFSYPAEVESMTTPGWPQHVAERADHAILEIKWTGGLPYWLTVMVEPLSPIDHGKFRAGMNALSGGLDAS